MWSRDNAVMHLATGRGDLIRPGGEWSLTGSRSSPGSRPAAPSRAGPADSRPPTPRDESRPHGLLIPFSRVLMAEPTKELREVIGHGDRVASEQKPTLSCPVCWTAARRRGLRCPSNLLTHGVSNSRAIILNTRNFHQGFQKIGLQSVGSLENKATCAHKKGRSRAKTHSSRALPGSGESSDCLACLLGEVGAAAA
jgi:hypothetical protein